jgi:HupH hydrogenase expression protein, C-terminal conserved region
MGSLEAIPVRLEAPTGNVSPLLHEIRHALERLLESGEPRVIDLKSLPITPTEVDVLEARLGAGEISARLSAFGRSEIRETAIAGVWIVEHYNNEDALMAKHIEITRVPDILCSQAADIAAGLRVLERKLERPVSS